MTKAEFENLIAAYGTDSARWPEDMAQMAQAFMTNSPDQAEKLMFAEVQLDEALNLVTSPAPSDLLKKRILNAASIKAANENSPAPKAGWLHWKSAAALMLGAFALGFGGANWLPSSGETSTEALYAQIDTSWEEAADELGLLDTYTWVEEDANL